jgi:hypothetical protein
MSSDQENNTRFKPLIRNYKSRVVLFYKKGLIGDEAAIRKSDIFSPCAQALLYKKSLPEIRKAFEYQYLVSGDYATTSLFSL